MPFFKSRIIIDGVFQKYKVTDSFHLSRGGFDASEIYGEFAHATGFEFQCLGRAVQSFLEMAVL